MSAKPESVIIRAIHEAFIKYPEGDGGPNLDYQWIQPEQSAHVAKAILWELAANGFKNCERRRLMMRIVLILLLLCSPALAHDASRPELNEWFNKLASGMGLCCSFADGFAVSDVDWESKDGHYRVRLENNWIDVPDDALITEPNRVGRTMVWPLRFDDKIFIRCFMPGSMS